MAGLLCRLTGDWRVNWNQLFQAIKRTRRGWLSATSKRFADALNNLFPSKTGSRRLKNYSCGQAERLEVRQVLSVTNPLASTFTVAAPNEVYSSGNSPVVSQSGEIASPTASQSNATPHVVNHQSNQPAMLSLSDHAEDSAAQPGFAKDLSTPAMYVGTTSGRDSLSVSAQTFDSISSLSRNSATQTTGQNTPSSSTSSDLATAGPGRVIAKSPSVSLNGAALRDTSPIRENSVAATLVNSPSNSAAVSTSNANAETAPEHPGFVPAASAEHASKNGFSSTGSASFIWHDRPRENTAIDAASLTNGNRKTRTSTATDFTVRTQTIISDVKLQLIADADAAEHISVNSRLDSASSNSTTNDSGRNWRSALTELERLFAEIDLFTSPFLSSIVDDENLHLTLSITAEETLPTAVPLLTRRHCSPIQRRTVCK